MSFLLDTCVVSELIKPQPNPGVRGWVDEHDESLLHLSVVTLGELHKEIAKLPPGERRERLLQWVGHDLVLRFEGRLLAVDLAVAVRWGWLLGEAERSGRPLPVVDALIAAAALVHRCAVVTRDAGHLVRTGVEVVNPWR